MDKYETADNTIKYNKDAKMKAAYEISGDGFHECITELYRVHKSLTIIANMLNEKAGENIITYQAVSSALMKVDITNRRYRKPKKYIPTKKFFKNEKSNKIKQCAKCDKKFERTLVNFMLCPQCYATAGNNTDSMGLS
jgi:hypothetical protein